GTRGLESAAGSASGPSARTFSAACAAVRPADGSRPSVRATSSAGTPYHRPASCAGATSVAMSALLRPCGFRLLLGAGALGLLRPRRAAVPGVLVPLLLPGGLERVGGLALRSLGLQLDLHLAEGLPGLLRQRRVVRVDLHQRVRQDHARADPGEPLVVRGDHVPRRPLRAGVGEHLVERLLVVVPALALARVRRGELPVLLRE